MAATSDIHEETQDSLPTGRDAGIASLFYGPILLAAQESEPRSDWRSITLDSTNLGKSITGDPDSLRFNAGELVFRPFYESYGRYSVYLDAKLK